MTKPDSTSLQDQILDAMLGKKPKKKARTAGKVGDGYVDFGEDDEWEPDEGAQYEALADAESTEVSGRAGLAGNLERLDTGLTGVKRSYAYDDEDDDYYGEGIGGTSIADDPKYKGIGGKATWGGASTGGKRGRWGWGWGTGKNSYYSSGGYSYSGYASRSYSSWYSGYSSAASAMRGVHKSTSSFVRKPEFTTLSIYPSTSASLGSDDSSRNAQLLADPERRKEHVKSSLHLRIDPSLYTRLGIEKAQQHYTIDCISQVLALQRLTDPGIVFEAQNLLEFPLPRLIREVITEVIRRRGLDLLATEMPGWEDRILSFRRAMILSADHDAASKPHGTSDLAWAQLGRFKCLMHMAWLPNEPAGVNPAAALEVITKLEAILDSPVDFRSPVKELTSLIVGFISDSVGLAALAGEIDIMLETLSDEFVRLHPQFPEPPVEEGAAANLYSGLRRLRAGISQHFRLVCDDAIIFPADEQCSDLPVLPGEPSCAEPFLARLERAQSYRRIIDLAALAIHRATGQAVDHTGQNPEPIFQQMDELNTKIFDLRLQQEVLDKDCHRIRVKYEDLLCTKFALPDGREVAYFTLTPSDKASIAWAHGDPKYSGSEPAIQLPVPAADYSPTNGGAGGTFAPEIHEQIVELTNQLNELRSQYHEGTKSLVALSDQGTQAEGELATAMDTMIARGYQVHFRFASGALYDAHERLSDLLKRLNQDSSTLSSEEMKSLFPERPGEEESEGQGEGGGESDEVLTVDKARGEQSRDKKRGKCFAHDHGDLIVDADVCAEDLPQVSGAGDPDQAPDIVVFVATNPDALAGRDS